MKTYEATGTFNIGTAAHFKEIDKTRVLSLSWKIHIYKKLFRLNSTYLYIYVNMQGGPFKNISIFKDYFKK